MLAGVAIAVSGLFLPLACTEAFHRDGPVISVCASYFTALRGSILPDNWPVENGLWVVAATSLVGLAVAAFAVFQGAEVVVQSAGAGRSRAADCRGGCDLAE